MKIIHVASELAPVAKVGGLGDVVLGLAREQRVRGHEVRVCIPKYECLRAQHLEEIQVEIPSFTSFFGGKRHENTIWSAFFNGLKIYLLEAHHPHHFFGQNTIYTDNDLDRFLYFSRAVLDWLVEEGWEPDIIHIHDWHTAVIAPLITDLFSSMGLKKTKVVLTIHNMAYQGICNKSDLLKVGLAGTRKELKEIGDPHHARKMNLLKGGIVYADAVVTVSETYAKEILTEEGGFGLNQTLLRFKDKLTGIINGLDQDYWNPGHDIYLPYHYTGREKGGVILKKKEIIKAYLREQLKMGPQEGPLVGCVSRLVPQKGIKLIQKAVDFTLQNGGQFILLGSSPDPKIQKEFELLKRKWSRNKNVFFQLQHQEELVHRIFAASDIVIVPSLFEPCGLTQLIALRYGAVPVVRHTGGLADTIHDVDQEEEGNGFAFGPPTSRAFYGALERAFSLYWEFPKKWEELIKHDMAIDSSWELPGKSYLKIYEHLAKGKEKAYNRRT